VAAFGFVVTTSYLLDTNVPSELTRPRPDSRVTAWIAAGQGHLNLSVISIGEIRRGFHLLPVSKRRTQLELWLKDSLLPLVAPRILPVTEPIAERWAELGAQCQLRGQALHLADGLIAATALEHGLVVATRNIKDFAGLGVELFNPWQA
jgi:predicted nucleic acid-binding protein